MPSFDIMWKFFIKSFSFIIGLSLIFNILGNLADRIAPMEVWRVEHQQRLENLEARNNLLEAVTLGNSHGDSINYSILGLEGQSLAFAAEDLFEVEKYAAYLDSKLPNLKTVFITISYYSFSRDNATFQPFRTRRIGFYSVVPSWSPIQGDLSNFVLGRFESYTHVMSVIRSDSWLGVWNGLVTNTNTTDLYSYDGVQTVSVWGQCSHYTEEQLENHAREIARKNVSSSMQMASVHPGLEQDSFNALSRTIEKLQSKGIRVILFTPTYYESYNTYFSEQGLSILENMKWMINQLQQTYKVEYYDFSDDSGIMVHPELFYNSDHLSECGQRVFSTKLLDAINKNGGLDN